MKSDKRARELFPYQWKNVHWPPSGIQGSRYPESKLDSFKMHQVKTGRSEGTGLGRRWIDSWRSLRAITTGQISHIVMATEMDLWQVGALVSRSPLTHGATMRLRWNLNENHFAVRHTSIVTCGAIQAAGVQGQKSCSDQRTMDTHHIKSEDRKNPSALKAKVYMAEVYMAEVYMAEVYMAEVNMAEVYMAEVYMAEVYMAEVYMAEVYMAEVYMAEVYMAEVYMAEVYMAEVYMAEVYMAEVYMAQAQSTVVWFIIRSDEQKANNPFLSLNWMY
ncbi:hypothetical protein NHX12_007656 [Muraenolepis orangiensis]|uniref:Uncharacterized protein n=1 Tax=Muraenolepis orangiensis TaxID=630683 RepID=A0A9Q0DQ95_9TELE|nr:hypothetical protein NHX12_007656 [Muraenolepis orangiensis]